MGFIERFDMEYKKIWVVSDLHLCHQAILKYESRPWNTVEEMNEALIERWNSVVGPSDRVYLLGDIHFGSKKNIELVGRLNGRKVLIKGNHDNQKIQEYLKYFDDVRGCVERYGYILTHIPVHPNEKRRYKGNIHGHLHADVIVNSNGELDNWYFNACVERNNYTPVLLENIIKDWYKEGNI